MFAVEIPRIYFYARFCGARKDMDLPATKHTLSTATPQACILQALAGMLPSTAAEIAEACGLEPVTAAACLDGLSARCQVMFNPLTKRYSLPKSRPCLSLAA